MTPEEQCITIAQAVGTAFKELVIRYPNGTENGRGNTPSYIASKFSNYRSQGIECELVEVWSTESDYLNDLNDMHEAEKVLTLERKSVYCLELNRHLYGSCSTAAQRAEALLKALGLWKEAV